MINQLHHLKSMKILTILSFLFLSATAASANSLDDKENFLITVSRFESAILKLNKHINKNNATRLGTLISIESKKRKIDPRVFLAIINTESSFNQKALNKNKNGSVDVSLAQINSGAWTPKRFKEKTGKTLDLKRLKENDAYAIWVMGEILSLLKNNFARKDKWWFANYHSATPSFKRLYITRLCHSFKQLKPFGRNLLKDMPEIKSLASLHQINPVEFASSNNRGPYEF